MTRVYLSTTIPYVNARPHIGHALELVQADVLARHYRRAGAQVRLQTGTDDNSLKNVLAADAAGVSVRDLVNRNAKAFASLREELSLSVDDFIRTSSDPRHRPGVERLWRACEASGDLYRRTYQGLYCTGCEQFYGPAELTAGNCPEHGVPPQPVAEENWFFRLSRFGGVLYDLIWSGELRIEPVSRRNEVLAFIAAGLDDFSASRPAGRARGWGIGVPGDPGQVIYVWWDALGNYITSLGYGQGTGASDYQRWWLGSGRRIHLAGKGVLRFHAVYWPAILLSAGLPLPTEIVVHDYLTAGGRKISKSSAPEEAGDPAALAACYGADALRWWLIRETSRTGDTDFTVERLVSRANEDLANGLGNLVSRVVSLAHASRAGVVRPCALPPGTSRFLAAGADGRADPGTSGEAGHATRAAEPAWPADAGALRDTIARTPDAVRAALEQFDFRAAALAVWQIVEQANRYAETAQPWLLASAERAGQPGAGRRLDEVLGALLAACQVLAAQLWPFVPDLAARVACACAGEAGRLPRPDPVFPRIDLPGRPASGPREGAALSCLRAH